MQLCTCGFANPDDATTCRACGKTLGEQSESKNLEAIPALSLANVRTGEVIPVPSPGVLGRAGDFAPDSFSPRVSGVHAVLALNDEGRWTIEHTGRNETSVERGGTWTRLRTGSPVPLFGGETLKLADMLFRVTVEEPRDPSTPALRASARDDMGEAANDVILSEQSESKDLGTIRWSVRCPVCGTEHAVASGDDRVACCTFCQDPMDARQIARVAPRTVPVS